MIPTTHLSNTNKITRDLFLLVGTLLLAFGLIVTTLYYEENEIDKHDIKTYDYHLTLSERSLNVLNIINQTKLWMIKHEANHYEGIKSNQSPIKTALSVRDQIESLQYSIDKSLNEIFLVQAKYSISEFEVITSLLLKSYKQFKKELKLAVANDNVNYVAVDVISASLFATVRQFRLLHQNAYKRDRTLAKARYISNKNKIFSLVFFISVIGIIGSIIIFKHVTDAFKNLDSANNSLFQKSRIIEQINDSVIGTNLAGVITSWNHASTELLGYKRDEMIGKNVALLYPKEGISQLENEIIPDLKSQGESRVEVILKHKSGKLIQVQLSLSMMRDENNLDVGMIGYSIDITKRKDYEKEISRLASVVENSPDFIGIATIEGKPLFLNDAGRKLVGIENDAQLFESAVVDFFYDTDRDIVTEQIIPTVMNKGKWSGDIYFRHFTTNESIPVWFDIFRIDDPITGEPINLATVTRDLTEIKIIEAQLSASELRFRTVLESTPSGIFQTDVQGRCIYINESYQKIAGIQLEDALGEGWANSIHPDDKDTVFSKWEDSVRERKKFEMEYRMVVSGDEVIWVYAQSMEEINELGEVISYIGTITDITENKLLNSELESYQSILEDRVEERTQSMKEALALAERANKAKSDFVSHMSHELRTPLNAILGFAQMLKLDKDDFNDEQNENVAEIYDAGQHLLGLINDVLDLAKIESGNFSVVAEEVVLNDVIEECLSFISNQAIEREITTFNNIRSKQYLVFVDGLKLKQVILNLLSNAVKYNRDKGRITIDAHTVDNDMLHISVTDTGYGLSKEEIPHVFENFERINQTNNVEGTGIGLVISKNIIELMGGKIGVNSEPSFGTVFWIEIPLFNQSEIDV